MFRSIVSKLVASICGHTGTTKLLLTRQALPSTSVSSHFVSNQFSTSARTNGLLEFFDVDKNWTEEKVKHGREWRIDELRLKSNVDLHKLWFVLLKERNMLLTMEEACKVAHESFPSPERIAKVDLSMENILHVTEERNIAHNILETGESNAYMPYNRYNSFGYIENYRPREYYVPWFLNKTWKLRFHHKRLPFWSKWYRVMLRAKQDKARKTTEKRIISKIKQAKTEYPEFNNEESNQYLRDFFEKKFNYRKKPGYEEMILKPRPDDIPDKFKGKVKTSRLLEELL